MGSQFRAELRTRSSELVDEEEVTLVSKLETGDRGVMSGSTRRLETRGKKVVFH